MSRPIALLSILNDAVYKRILHTTHGQNYKICGIVESHFGGVDKGTWWNWYTRTLQKRMDESP